MKKYEVVKEYVYSQFSKISYEPLQSAAYTHTAMVDSCITLLAISRNVRVERAKICALFHDYAQFVDNCPHKEHAKLSSLYCSKFLKETNLFKINEIDDICYAIRTHSKKDRYDSPLCEVLKDADVLARFLENPEAPLNDIEKERLMKAMQDISK
ncbi:HD domain-containing protein [Floccifex sp.]|uniref:HD domain-containing protein n=1 Tax=Floccifex sp. TaxID=2815810 RepID=UPI002A75EC27|nr:HD domain-containing protein [Floccifex sp.]MDD7281590.1 HD domain-containing protein [Erysipelotrichaceae bacterium]MDY2958173.1 HD domain-containing protein [Floccifex sp.]